MGLTSESSLIALSLLALYVSPRNLSRILSEYDLEELLLKKPWGSLPLSEETRARLEKIDWKQVEQIAGWCRKNEVKIIQRGPSYPEKLSRLADPPLVLYLWGEQCFQDLAVAVVGTRNPTNYGREVTYRITRDLAEAGLVIVSGMARGLDSVAHQAALEAGGKTIAVLGSGFQNIYPPENRALALKIKGSGCLISEYPPTAPPNQWHFPARNRIIASLSSGVVVIEAGENSGALITCDFALEIGVDVYAVPGSILSATSKGCHRLIKEGAKLVESAQDILEDMGLQPALEKRVEPDLSPEEKEVLKLLPTDPTPLEELIKQLNREAGTILAVLTMLEVKGLIRSLPGKYYVRRF